jgi:hypothetical protein
VLDVAGSPVAGAAVFVRGENGHVLECFSMIESDSAGRFHYTGVAPGHYTVSARTSDLASAESQPVELREGGVSETLIALDAGTKLKISVVDDLDAIVQADIRVTDDEGRQVNGMIAYQEIINSTAQIYNTEEQTVGPLSPGRYTVTAVAEDGRTVSKPVTLSGPAERSSDPPEVASARIGRRARRGPRAAATQARGDPRGGVAEGQALGVQRVARQRRRPPAASAGGRGGPCRLSPAPGSIDSGARPDLVRAPVTICRRAGSATP